MNKFFLMSFSLFFFSCAVIAQDDKKKDKKTMATTETTTETEKKKPEELSLQSIEFYDLQQAYRKEKKKIFAPYKEKLLTLLQKPLDDAEELFKKKKRSGNIRGMAIAKKTKSIFIKAIEKLKTKGEFKLPKKARKELRETINTCKEEQKNILTGIDDKYSELDSKYDKKFEDVYKLFFEEGKAPDKASIAKKFQQFLTTEILKPAEKEEVKKNEDIDSTVMTVPKKPKKPLSLIIASQGTGEKWIDIGRWTADMMGMDVVTIPLLEKSRDFTETQYFAIADADSKLFYKAINPMPAHKNYSFRLKRIAGKSDVDVMEWPSNRNDWALVVRTRGAQDNQLLPIKHGFIFQVSLPDENELTKLFGNKITFDSKGKDIPGVQKKKKKKTPKVKVSAVSNPKGAKIYVDDEPYRSKGKLLYTPCKIIIHSGECKIQFSKFGYQDKIIEKFKAAKGTVIKVKLDKDNSFKYYKTEAHANAKTWTSTGVALKPGDNVVIQVEGLWCCTKSTKAKCGPRGIPNTKKNYKYYADSSKDVRQIISIPYGALLMKLEAEGKVQAISRNTKFTVKKSGEIMFDINEREGRPRKGNKGKLLISIAVKSE